MEISEPSIGIFYVSKLLALAPYSAQKNSKGQLEIRRSWIFSVYSACTCVIMGRSSIQHGEHPIGQVLKVFFLFPLLCSVSHLSRSTLRCEFRNSNSVSAAEYIYVYFMSIRHDHLSRVQQTVEGLYNRCVYYTYMLSNRLVKLSYRSFIKRYVGFPYLSSV